MSKPIDLTGQRFGLLVVDSMSRTTGGRSFWFCTCDCGGVKEVLATNLRSGATISCGCRRRGPKLQVKKEKIRAHVKKTWHTSVRGLVNLVAEEAEVTEAQIMGTSKHHRIVDARRLVFLVLRISKWSYPDIGDKCGGYDHSTVLYSVSQATADERALAELLAEDWEVTRAVKVATAEQIRREELFALNCAKWADMWRSDAAARVKVAYTEDEL